QRSAPDPLPPLRGKAHFPLASSKLDRHQQSVTTWCRKLIALGRGCHHARSFQNGDSRAELNSRDPPHQQLCVSPPSYCLTAISLRRNGFSLGVMRLTRH